MMVVCTGPESSGKSTLARTLAARYGGAMVAEQAREYLQHTNYLPTDLLAIAELQRDAERRQLGARWCCADTDLQVIYLWWQERFGPAPGALAEAYAAQAPRHYLLCRPDLEWHPDPLRQNPDDRDRLFELYRQDLDARDLPYTIVEGQGEAREVAVHAALSHLRLV